MSADPARWTLALTTALVLTTHAAAAATDACALFTASQVSAALGVAVSQGQYPIASSLLLCSWTGESAAQLKGEKLHVSIMTERAFEIGKVPLPGTSAVLLQGPADDAYFSTASGLRITLSIKKGGAYVRIRVGGFPVAKEKQMEQTLALQLLPTL